MRLRSLFVMAAVAAVAFTCAFLLFPAGFLSAMGLPVAEDGLWLSRLLGASSAGYALLAWFSRDARPSRARRAAVVAFAGVWSLGFAVLLVAQLAGWTSPLGWMMVILFLMFAFLFGRHAYSAFRRTDRRAAEAMSGASPEAR